LRLGFRAAPAHSGYHNQVAAGWTERRQGDWQQLPHT